MSKPSRVIVVLEDEHHKRLIQRYLKSCGLHDREMRILLSPSARGSAEHWVKRNFVEEVIRYRNRSARAKTALIVVIDADRHTVQARLRPLDQALKDAQKEVVNARRDQIARLVPRRNIETWILCLNDRKANEETDYKTRNHDWNDLIPNAANRLFEWTRSNENQPNHSVESLRRGAKELKRLALRR